MPEQFFAAASWSKETASCSGMDCCDTGHTTVHHEKWVNAGAQVRSTGRSGHLAPLRVVLLLLLECFFAALCMRGFSLLVPQTKRTMHGNGTFAGYGRGAYESVTDVVYVGEGKGSIEKREAVVGQSFRFRPAWCVFVSLLLLLSVGLWIIWWFYGALAGRESTKKLT